MFKKTAFLAVILSSLLVLVLGCQTAKAKKQVPASEAKREALEAKVEADVQGEAPKPEDKNVIDQTDDWIKKNLW
jgi:heme exporter protein D